MTSNRMEKEIEGWQRKTDAYYKEFMWHGFSTTPSTFSENQFKLLTCTLIPSIISAQNKSITSINYWYGFRQCWLAGNLNLWLIFVDDNSINIDMAVPGLSDVKNQIIISIWTLQICLFYGALFHYLWTSHSGCSASSKNLTVKNIQMDKSCQEIKPMAENTERGEEEIRQTASKLSDERVG